MTYGDVQTAVAPMGGSFASTPSMPSDWIYSGINVTPRPPPRPGIRCTRGGGKKEAAREHGYFRSPSVNSMYVPHGSVKNAMEIPSAGTLR